MSSISMLSMSLPLLLRQKEKWRARMRVRNSSSMRRQAETKLSALLNNKGRKVVWKDRYLITLQGISSQSKRKVKASITHVFFLDKTAKKPKK
jgi:hypothetical protein